MNVYRPLLERQTRSPQNSHIQDTKAKDVMQGGKTGKLLLE